MLISRLTMLELMNIDTGSLACSPFHVRFGKFSLLRPYEKKVNLPDDFFNLYSHGCNLGRVQCKQCQAKPCHEARRRWRSIFRLRNL